MGGSGRIEDRKFQRVEVNSLRIIGTLAVQLTAKHTTGCQVPIKDISLGGVGVYTKIEIMPFTQVRLSFDNLPHFGVLNGKVAWCLPLMSDPGAPAGYEYRLGIEFFADNESAKLTQSQLFEHFVKLVSP